MFKFKRVFKLWRKKPAYFFYKNFKLFCLMKTCFLYNIYIYKADFKYLRIFQNFVTMFKLYETFQLVLITKMFYFKRKNI